MSVPSITLTDGDRTEIIEAASRAQQRQEHRTYRAIVVGFAVCALILLLCGALAFVRIETLIHENREATLANRAQAEAIRARQEEISDRLAFLVVKQERGTQRILRSVERDLAQAERRVTRILDALLALGGGARFPDNGSG